jgi:hypothetical protein
MKPSIYKISKCAILPYNKMWTKSPGLALFSSQSESLVKGQPELRNWKPPATKAQQSNVQQLSEGEIPKKKSFAKELLLGRFDTDVLTFPEVLDKERHETLHEMLGPIERFFREEGSQSLTSGSINYRFLIIIINCS